MNTTEFARLYRSYRGMVLSIARGVVADECLAEDVTQEVFFRLSREASVAYPCAWLRRVTKRLALNWARDRRRRAELLHEGDSLWLDEEEASAVEVLIGQDLHDRLLAESKTWPEEFHATAARMLSGERPSEIQEALGLTSGTVSSRVHRIRKRFESFLDSQKEDEGGACPLGQATAIQ